MSYVAHDCPVPGPEYDPPGRALHHVGGEEGHVAGLHDVPLHEVGLQLHRLTLPGQARVVHLKKYNYPGSRASVSYIFCMAPHPGVLNYTCTFKSKI